MVFYFSFISLIINLYHIIIVLISYFHIYIYFLPFPSVGRSPWHMIIFPSLLRIL